MTVPAGTVRTGGTLEYCRMNGITIQSWSTLQYGFFEGTFLNNREKYPELNRKLDELAAKYGVTAGAIATAFVLRIPGVGQAVIGTTKPERIRELAAAGSIRLTHGEWYEIYRSAGNKLP
jgi:predicted oxidoreductase